MNEQNYENYWKLTLEYTNFNGDNFLMTLKTIVKFIDDNKFDKVYRKERYVSLQNEVNHKIPKTDMASVRKSINQFVKLGFIKDLISYNQETIEFLNAKTDKQRKSIFSKIVYKYSSFNSSITHPHNWSQINFLLKTLEEIGKLHKLEVIALMLVDIEKHNKGYVNQTELNDYTNIAKSNGFIERKYNQVGYLFNLLKKLDDIIFINDNLYFTDEAKKIFREVSKIATKKKRDGYLHLLYKRQLQAESTEMLGQIKCMLEKLSYPSLVASHIKPFIQSNESEAYDPNNGLLLSRNMDILFDQGYISFQDNGKLMLSSQLNQDVINSLYNYQLDNTFINSNRKRYLNYHRTFIFKNR